MSKHSSDISVQSITRRISYLVRSCFTHTSGGETGAVVISPPPTTKSKPEDRGIENPPQTIRIPFTILERYLPEEAKACVTQRSMGTAIDLPKNLVLERIATGAFRITLGELYQFVKKPGLPVPTSEHLQLEIPLKEILALVDPESLPRKKPKKRIIPPLDIPAPFQPPSKIKQMPEAVPEAVPHPSTTQPLNGKSTIARIETDLIWGRQTLDGNHRQVPGLAILPKAAEQANTHTLTPEARAIRQANSAAPTRRAENAVFDTPGDTPEPLDQAVTDSDGYTVFRLQDLWGAWPTQVKTDELLRYKDAPVYIPDAFLQVELKKGRLLCTADTLKSWIRDPKARRAMPNSNQFTLELPLKIIVPAFIQKTGQTRQTPRPFESGPAMYTPAHHTAPIPELRTDTVIRQASIAVEQTTAVGVSSSPRPEPTTTTVAAPQPAVRKPDPAGLVAQALTLPGVAGAIIALPNGVIAAQKLPKDLNPDAVAEFVHRAMDQINQCATVLRQGYTTRLSFTVGEISWAIFKRGAIYFAVMSRPNQMLPEESLGLLAAELESTRQPRQQPWQS